MYENGFVLTRPIDFPPTVTMDTIKRIHDVLSSNNDERIVLLKNIEVLQWLFGDLSFLPPIEKKNKSKDNDKYKVLEDKWGQETLRKRRPDLTLDKQWTNKFGEHLCEELCILAGKTPTKPVKKEHFQPDTEVEDSIWEAKAGTYYTIGTAHEKILGCPFKYAEVPRLYSKPLRILCMGGAEQICKEKYGNLGSECSLEKKTILDCYKSLGIEYVSATEMLKTLLNC